jgi:Mg-chelatase subunit ChlD
MGKREVTSAVLALYVAGTITLGASPATADEKSKAKPHIDLAFCIDTTGSMKGEIENVKAKTKEIVAKLASGKPTPVVRVGLVAYRDRGDTYVTKIFPFSGDIDKVVKDISGLEAEGGGDTPESVNEALHVAVHDLQWDDSKKTLKMLFLIGDAGPNVYPHDYDWRTESKTAVEHGIQISTIGCQGIEDNGAGEVWREIAHLADGKYEPLSYRQEVATADGKKKTVISSGGKTFEVMSKDKEAWRGSVEALAKSGALRAVSAAAPAAMPRGGAAGGEGFASAYEIMGAPRAETATSSFAPDRGDSNLSDMVLQQTEKAAAKRLGINFETK